MTRTRHAAPPRRSSSVRGLVGGIVGSALAAAGLLFVTAACGSTLQTVPAREAPPVGGPAPAAVTAPGGLATVDTALGTIVTSDGFTVYRFDKDTSSPSKSACTGGCEKTWPPLLGDGTPSLSGVPEGLVGTVGRADGSQQLTLNGWPLYRYAKDTAPGETKGEGVGGTWRAVGADGKPASAAAKAPAAPAAPAAPEAPEVPATPAPAADDYSSSGY